MFSGGYAVRSARVVLVDGLSEARARNVSVDLGGTNVGVAEHTLDAAQISAAFEKMSGERVAQNMRADRFA
jgi:hypothetical protein